MASVMQEFNLEIIETLFNISEDAVAWFYPVFSTDEKQIIDFEAKYANKACGDFFGVPVEDLNGITVRSSKFFPDKTRESTFAQCLKVWTTGDSMQDSFYNPVFDKHLNIHRSKVHNGVITVIREETELVRANLEIENQASKLQSILDASPNGVFAGDAIRNTEGKIIDVCINTINRAFTKITGLTEEQIIGKAFSEVFPETFVKELLPIHLRVMEGGEPLETELYYTGKSVEQCFLMSVSKCGKDGVVQTFQDQTSYKKLQEQLELAAKGLKQSTERLTELTYIASHDLNEPLRKVATFTKLLAGKLGNDADSSVLDYMTRIDRTVERMQEMLDSLLTYSRATKQSSVLQKVNLNSVVRTVLNDLESQIFQKLATINTEELPEVNGDSKQIRQLFQNLISNSLKFQEAGKKPVINISPGKGFTSDSGKVYVTVIVGDNGIGFDPRESEKIFQLFHRLHARHEYEGSGIGLAIVQRIMENHNGFVQAFGKPGEGAEIVLYFPVAGLDSGF